MPNHCYYLAISFTKSSLPILIYLLAMHLRYSSAPLVYWRASVASETVLGVDNAKSGICYIYIYVCMYGWYVCSLNARAGNSFLLKTRLFNLDSTLF